MNMGQKQENRYRRHRRIRAKIKGTAACPRFSVFRSNKHIYGRLIDDDKGHTLISGSDLELKPKTQSKNKKAEKKFSGKIEVAYQVGQLIAEKALAKKIKKVVFDRGGYKYHGRVKAMADGAREGGLKF
jgi:large subunit ribosomal protein L18